MDRVARLRDVMSRLPTPDNYLPPESRVDRAVRAVSKGVSDIGQAGLAIPALGEQGLIALGFDAPTTASDALQNMASAESSDQQVRDLRFSRPNRVERAVDGALRSAPSSLLTLPLGFTGGVARETAKQIAMRSALMAAPGGAVSAGQNIGQDLAEGGYTPMQIAGRAMLQGALEAGGEAIPIAGHFGGEAMFLKRMMQAAEKRGLGQAFKKSLLEMPPELLAQGVQEAITSAAQSVAGDVTNKDSVGVGDMAMNAADQALDGFLSGGIMGGMFHGAHVAKAGVSDVMDRMALSKALGEIEAAPVERDAALAAATTPGITPESAQQAAAIQPMEPGASRQAVDLAPIAAPEQRDPAVSGIAPVPQMASPEQAAAPAPTYDPAQNVAQAQAQRATEDRAVKLAELAAVNAAVPPAGKPAKGTKQPAGANAAPKGDWAAFDPQETLGIPRASMPQVRSADRPELIEWMKSQGVRATTETVDPASLKPTQAEFAPSKVQAAVQEAAAAKAAGKPVRPVMVSADGYVIDGHHQWLAAKAAGETVPVIRVNLPAAQALQTIKRFPKAGRAGGAEGAAATANQRGANPAPTSKGPNAGRSPSPAPGAQPAAPAPAVEPVAARPAPAAGGTPVAAAAAPAAPAGGSAAANPAAPGVASSQPQAEPVVSGETASDSTQAAEPAQSPGGVAGEATTIDVPGGQDLPARYEVRELDNLIASSNYSSGQAQSDSRYPADLQPRNYAPGSAEDLKVHSFAQGQKAGYYVNTDPSAANGPPTVTVNGTVLNGNGRAMSLQLAASRGDMGWYRRELDRQAGTFGLDPVAYAGMRQPVLVRVVTIEPTSPEAQRFARAGNVSSTQAQSPVRTAASLGNLVDQGVLDTIELDDETTFSEAVSGSAGRDFRQALASSLPPQEVPRYLNEQTGQLTDAGKELVRDLLLTKTFPVELIERMRETRKGMLRSLEQAIPQLMRLEGVAPEADVTEHLTKALDWISRHPDVTLPTQLAESMDASGKQTQQDLTGRDDGLSPEARMLAEWMLANAGKGRAVKQGLVSLIKGLDNRNSPILADTRSGGQIAADALGVPMAPGAEFGAVAEPAPALRLKQDGDTSVRQLASQIRASMPGAQNAIILPDGPFGVIVQGKKTSVKVRMAQPADLERVSRRMGERLDKTNLNGWAEGDTIYLVPGGATAFTYNHELVHALEQAGVLTHADIAKLAKLADKVLTPNEISAIRKAYSGASAGTMARELAAHTIEIMKARKARPPVIDRVLAWLRDMAALLRIASQSDWGMAKDVASGKVLDKRARPDDAGDDVALSRRKDAPGQQSLFGEPAAAKPEPKAEKPAEVKTDPVAELAKKVDKLEKGLDLDARLRKVEAAIAGQQSIFDSPPAPAADTRTQENTRGPETGAGAGAAGARSGNGRRTDAGAAGAGQSGRNGRGAEGGSVGDDGRGTRGADGNGADAGAADRQQPDGRGQGPVRNGERNERSAPAPAPVERPAAIRPTGFRYGSVEEAMPPRGDITRARANLDAIKTYQLVSREGRQATAEERATIAKFSGWGSLKWVFNPETANGNDKSRRELYHDAMKVMSEEDRHMAEAANDEADEATTPVEDGETRQRAIVSTLNAHYTHPQVVADTWAMVEGMLGDRIPMGLRALEPSVGMGVFVGLEPMSMRGRTAWSAVELEPLTAGMVGKVYSDVAVVKSGYESFDVPDNSYDLVISNFPFGSYRPFDRRYAKIGKPLIHDYFFVKSMDKVRPGGLVVGITSTGTMDKPDDTVRQALYERADLVHAIRFPANAHDTAGTAVVTDLLIFRKRMPGEAKGSDAWTKVGKVADANGGSAIPMNLHFVRNPDMVLGTSERSGKLHGLDATGEKRPNVVKRDTYQQELEAAMAKAPKGIVPMRPAGDSRIVTIPAPADLKPGSIVGKDGKLWQKQGAELVLVDDGKSAADKADRASWMRTLIANLRSVWKAELNGTDAVAERAILNKTYDGGFKRFGSINDRKNLNVFAADPDAPNLMALEVLKSDENDEDNQVWGKGPSFEKPMLRPATVMGRAENGTQGVAQSLAMTGTVDPDTVAKSMGVSSDEAAAAMRSEGAAFEDPITGWQARWVYLSGNVKAKLAEATEAARRDSDRYQANVKALESVQPKDREANEITPTLGAAWVPEGIFQRFMAERAAGVRATRGAEGRWIVSGKPTDTANATWSVKGVHRTADATDIANGAFNGASIRMSGKDKDGKTLPDVEADRAAAEKANAMREAFMDWIRLPEQSRLMVETVKAYNDVVNVYHREVADDSWLTFDGMNPKFATDPQRRRAVARAIAEGRLFLAHDVGTGKTVSLTAIAIESKRLGLAKKPVIATLNNVVAQFGREALEAYPGKNILIQPAEWGATGTPTSRSAFMSRLATQDYDVAIISHETLTGIKNDPRVEAEHMRDKLKELEAAIREAKSNGDGSMESKRAVAGLAKRIENLRAGMLELQSHVLKRDHITFEEMGIDQLLIDEAHQFKNLGIITAQEKILGLGGGDSTRAEDLLIKSKTLHARNGGERGLFMATGTPISNSMVEVFAFQTMMQPASMDAAMVKHFDDWSRSFGTTKQTNEVQADGTRKSVTRYASWVNTHGLAAMLREFMDVSFTHEIPRVWEALPGMREVPVKIPLTERQRAYREFIGERLDAIKRQGKPEKGMDIGLVAMRDAMLSSIDMRLVDPKATEADGSKLPETIAGVAKLYHTGPKVGTKFPTQFIFQNVQSNPNAWGFNINTALVAGLVKSGIPANRIAVLDGNMSKAKRNKIKSEAKAGKYAVLIGNTEVLGTGTNAQDYALASWHLDVPYRPADIIQRDGRVRRQGNKYKKMGVDVLAHRVITEGTLDEALWARVGLKAQFIYKMLGAVSTKETDAVMREVETEGMDPEMVAALASGDPDLIRAVELEEEVGKLRREKAGHYNQKSYLESQARTYTGTAEAHDESFTTLDGYAKTVQNQIPEKAQLDDGTDSKALDAKLLALAKKDSKSWNTDIQERLGNYAGMPVAATNLRRNSTKSWNEKARMWVEDTSLDAVVTYGDQQSVIELKEGSGATLLGQLKQKAKAFGERAMHHFTEASKLRQWAKANQEKAANVGAWPKEAEYAAKASDLKALNATIRSKPKIPNSLSNEARVDFNGGMWARSAAKTAAANAKRDRAAAKGGKVMLSRRIIDQTEEGSKTEREIVNPVDPSLSDEAKAAELTRLTQENRSIVAGIIAKARAMGLMKAGDNVKDPAKVVQKASRPEILAKKPWHGVEHIRDSYRFKLPIQRLDQIPKLFQIMLEAGVTPVKYDSEKLFAPKAWGWRFVGMDMRMPNGQLVETYMPFEQMDDKAVKGPNHHLFEAWRNQDMTAVRNDPAQKAAFDRDVAESRARYDAAFKTGLEASGYADEAAARAAFASIEARLESLISEYSLPKSAALPSGGSRFHEAPSSSDIMGTEAGDPASRNTTTASSDSQASSMTSPSGPMVGARDSGSMSDVRTEPMLSKRIGRPDLANPGTTGPVRGMMDEVDEARNQAGEPQVKPDDEREAAAEARFKADPDGERRKLMDKYRRGEFTTDEETRIAHHLINRDGLRAITTRSGDEMLAATKLMAAYRANGSEMARAFRARADRMATPEERVGLLTQAILTPPAEILQQVRGMYENGQAQEAEALLRKHTQAAKQVLDVLKGQGIDPNDLTLPDKLVDPVTMARVLRTVSTLRTKFRIGDVLLEYWINAVLSGPLTHIVNTVGNVASTSWDFTVQRWAEAAVGMVSNTEGKARIGELLPTYKALFTALPKAARNFARSFSAEQDVFEWEVNGVPVAGQQTGNKVEDRAAIKGVKGRIIRTATRLLTASDSFMKTVIGHAQATAEAYRTGIDRGLSGAQLDTHMASELADYGSKSWHNALGYAQELTFQKNDSAVLQGIQKLRNLEIVGGIKPMAFVLPFTRTPWNIMATGVRKTPLGSAALAYRLAKEGYRRSFDKYNAEGAYAGRDAVRHAAEQTLAWGIMLALIGAVYDRDERDRPLITGTGEGFGGDRGKRDAEGRMTPPLSIRIGDTWYSYARIEPFATAMGLMVDMIEAQRTGGGISSVSLAKTGSVLMEQVRNKTFLQGISDLMNAVEDPERFGSRYTANFAASWMPNLIRQPLRATQEVMPEGKPLASEPGDSAVGLWLRTVGRSMVPIESMGAPPKIDVWGREIPRSAQQNTSWVARMAESLTWPMPRRMDRGTELDLILKSYNEAHPDEAWWPTVPAAYYKANGQRVDMTEGQYNAFLRERGQFAMQQLGGLRWSESATPQAYQIEMIQKALRRATTYAKAKILSNAGAEMYRQADNLLQKESGLDVVRR
jgi:N12 class adenine-specific DNA methylase/superfamily II DNA/RNA helicase